MKKKPSLALCLIFALFALTLGQTPDVKIETAAPFATQGQQSSQPQPQQTPKPQNNPRQEEDEVVKITTNLVQVDLVVTDKKGRQVTDLRPEEMQILEDGREQKITNFSYVETAPENSEPVAKPVPVDKSAPPLPPVRLRPEQVRRTIALVVDDLGLSFESVYYTQQALKKFVDTQMQPGDLVAIIRTGGGIGALQQFTSDKRQLYAAIERVRWNPQGRGGVGAFSPMQGGSLNKDIKDDNGAADELNEFREDLFAVGTLGALNFIVRGLRHLPGRKSIVLLSEGFSLFSGASSVTTVNGNRTTRFPLMPQGSNRILESLRRLTDLANRSSVIIYSIDPRGLQMTMLTAADDTYGMSGDDIEARLRERNSNLFDTQTSLNYLAQETGGFAIINNNDMNKGLGRVLDDQKGYYLIGYRPDDSTFDPKTGGRRFHKLSAKVTRTGLRVRMRSGFYGITDEEIRIVRRTGLEQLVAAITSPFASGEIPLRLTSIFGNAERGGSFVRSLLNVDANGLTFTNEPDDWHKAVFDVVAITFGDNGRVIDEVSRTYTMRVKGDVYRRVLRNGFVYYVNVPIKKAGAYQLRTALRDTASERIGSASQFIEIPDLNKNRLTLSGLILAGVDASTTAKIIGGGSANTEGAYYASSEKAQKEEDTLTVDPQAGPAVRRFHPGSVLQYGYVIYNARLDRASRQPQLQTQLRLFHDGQKIYEGKLVPLKPDNLSDLKRIEASGALQLGSDMKPGEYILQVVVTDPLAKEKHRTATQWIDFEIVRQ